MNELIIRISAGCAAGVLSAFIAERMEKKAAENRGLEHKETKMKALWYALQSAFCAAYAVLSKSYAGCAYFFVLVTVLAAVSLSDIKYSRIPNSLVLAVIVNRIAFTLPSFWNEGWYPALNLKGAIAGLAACLVLFLLPSSFGKNIGYGDVKLAAALGFCLGLAGSLVCICIMGLAVLACVAARKVIPGFTKAGGIMDALKARMPLGPALSFAAAVVTVYDCVHPMAGLTGVGL